MEALVVALVLGGFLIAIAAAGSTLLAVGTRALVSPSRSMLDDPLPRSGELPLRPDSAVAVSILCPRTQSHAEALLAIDRGRQPSTLTVLGCEHFPEGDVRCEMECLGEAVVA